MEEATSIKAIISSLWWCVCATCVREREYMVTSGVTVRVSIISKGVNCEVLVGKYEWGGVKSVGAYHERERLCPEGMEVWEVARVHYVQLQVGLLYLEPFRVGRGGIVCLLIVLRACLVADARSGLPLVVGVDQRGPFTPLVLHSELNG